MSRDSKGRFTAAIDVQLIDRSSSLIRKITNNFEALERTGKKASKAFELAANMKQSADGVKNFASGAASALKGPIDKMMDFEEQMSSVKAATFDLTKSMTPDEFKEMEVAVAKLSATARELGATTKYSALEAAGGMDILAKNFSGGDMEKAKNVAAAMPGILQAAAATKESIADTADVFSASMNQFSLKAEDMGRIGDVYVKTANGSATGLLDLGEAMKYAGVTASQAGLDLETTLGIMGALGNAGKKGSVAGTGLASVLGSLQSAAKKPRSALSALGIDIKDKNGNLRPVLDIFAEIDKAADKKFGKGKGGVRRDRWLQGVVGMGSDKETLAILTKQAGSGDLQKLVQANKEAAGTAAAVAVAMNSNAAGSAKELESSYEELQLTIGATLIPTVTELLKLVKTITDDVAAWAKENETFVTVMGYVVGGVAGLAGLVYATITIVGAAVSAWGALVTVWGYLVTAAGWLAGAFTSIKLAIMANPIVAIITGIAVAAGLIYYYWEPISEFFAGVWDWVVEAMEPFMPMLQPIIDGANILFSAWEPVKGFFSGLWEGITTSFGSAMDWILGKIGWVGEKVTEFYDELDSKTLKSGFAKWEPGKDGRQEAAAAEAAATASASDTIANIKSSIAGWVPAANDAAPAANGTVAQGPSLLNPGQASAASRFDGNLKITIDANGVPRADLITKSDANFEVRVNKGAQG